MNHRKRPHTSVRHLRSLTLLSCAGAALLALASASAPGPANESPAQRDQRMAWFRDARFGMFIQNLIKTLPEYRHPALREQLDLLDRTIEKIYVIPEDLALARIADSQGLGGSS